MYETHLHPNIKLGSLTRELRLQLFEACEVIVTQFYSGTREKIVYKKQADPRGCRVEALTVGSRTAYWVPTVQTIQ
jgi:hypothetical protein